MANHQHLYKQNKEINNWLFASITYSMKLPEKDFGKQLSRMPMVPSVADGTPSEEGGNGADGSGYLGLYSVKLVQFSQFGSVGTF